MERMLASVGKPLLNKDGVAHPTRKLTQSTAKQMVDGLHHLVRYTETEDDFPSGLRDYEAIITITRGRYKNNNSYKSQLNYIVSVAKYVPEFKQAIGDEAYNAYQQLMVERIGVSNRRAVANTSSREAAIPSIRDIRRKLPAIKAAYGDGSLEYLAALLQSSIIGLRDNLGPVRIVESDDTPHRNFYNIKTKRLVIKDFKTAASHEPYDLKLAEALHKAIKTSLRKHPRDFLIKNDKLGTMIKAAFTRVGMPITLMTIRHAQSSDLQRKGYGAAHLAGIAAQFKHSVSEALKYARLTKITNYGADAE
jgi:hypothetical protein